MKKTSFLSLMMTVSLIFVQAVYAQAPKGPVEKIYPLPYEQVWDKLVEVLTEKGLSEHPHGKMSADKDSGKITTPTFRYFKIFSAKPVVKEIDYRDTYTITVLEESAAKAREAKAKAEEAKAKAEEAKTLTGAEAKEAEAEAKTISEAARKAEQEAKALAGKPKVVKVQIQRKFEVHDDTKRAWVDGDPNVEKLGISEEVLFSALDGKLAPAPADTAKKEEIKK